jgi:hypothetical protein
MHMSLAKEQPSRVAEIGIRRFQEGDAAAFRRLNEEWITRLFRIEPKDMLADSQSTILDSAAGYSSRRPGNDASAAAH